MTDTERERHLRRLRFPEPLERAFQEDHYARNRGALRLGLILISLVVVVLAINTYLQTRLPVFVLLVFTPLLTAYLGGWALSFRPGFARWWQAYFVVVLGLIVTPILFGMNARNMDAYVSGPWAPLLAYSRVVLAGMIWTFALLRLQFKWMLALQVMAVGASAGSALAWLGVPADRIFQEYARFILPSLALIMLAAYSMERAQRSAYLANHLLELERSRSEAVLLNVLPNSIAERLKTNTELIADDHQEVTVLFADIADFTLWCGQRPAREVLRLLNEVFSRFDRLVEAQGIEKIKTVGDCYMAISGAPTPRADHVEAVARLALAMQAEAEQLSREQGVPVRLRIGIHTGSLAAGVIGVKRFLYDVWGDTVNTASRLEAQGEAGTVHVSAEVAAKLPDRFQLRRRGEVEIKGKGLMETYVLESETVPPREHAGAAAEMPLLL